MSPFFEELASYYALFTWVYDAFNELLYLRVRGDFGSGKTRFLLTVGSLCYKPIFASGASTISPIFRILDAFRGTLVIDEGNFRLSDERAEVVKILNNGNVRGFPVLRSELTSQKEFDPRAYSVFGPKLIATRGFLDDPALESRFLTEDMGQNSLRKNIPINLPNRQKEEALGLRNKLLLFSFKNLAKPRDLETAVDRTIEPRLSQIFTPLLSIIEDRQARENLKGLARCYHRALPADRGTRVEAQVLEVIRDMIEASPEELSVKAIAGWFADRHGEDYDRKVTPRWIGSIIRKKLRITPERVHGVFVIPRAEQRRCEQLYERYGITPAEASEHDTARPGASSEDKAPAG